MEVPVTNIERDLKITCCSETGSLYVTTTNSDKKVAFMDSPNVIVNCTGSIGAISNDLEEVTASTSNYNCMCNGRNSLYQEPSNNTCNFKRPLSNGDNSSASIVCAVHGTMRHPCVGPSSSTPGGSNCGSLGNSLYNRNIESGILPLNKETGDKSQGSTSPDVKRQRTMLEKTCAIWEGFEPLKPTRQLTVAE